MLFFIKNLSPLFILFLIPFWVEVSVNIIERLLPKAKVLFHRNFLPTLFCTEQ